METSSNLYKTRERSWPCIFLETVLRSKLYLKGFFHKGVRELFVCINELTEK